MKSYIIIVTALVSFTNLSCSDENVLLVPPELDTGTADFSKFIALGNSLTAGFQSGALLSRDSKYSFPNLIAQQVNATFVQPEIKYPGIGGYIDSTNTTLGVYELISRPGVPTQQTAVGNPLSFVTNSAVAPNFNNLGIPGITSLDMTNAVNSTTTQRYALTGEPNIFVDIVLGNSGNSALSQALSEIPTFVTLWIGINDVLGSALSGGTFPPTPVSEFETHFRAIAGALDSAGIDFVVGNIPDIRSIPYMTYILPYTQLSDGTIVPWEGVTDPENSLILLSAYEYLLNGNSQPGSGVNIPTQYWLNPEELTLIYDAVSGYNNVINSVAGELDFGVADINSILSIAATSGIQISGEILTTSYISGGIFSYDGIHPSSKGYGIIANKFISVINARHGSNIRLVDINSLPGPNILPGKAAGASINLGEFFVKTRLNQTLMDLFPGFKY